MARLTTTAARAKLVSHRAASNLNPFRASLKRTAKALIYDSLASSTRRAYTTAFRQYRRFASAAGYDHHVVSEASLLLFVACLRQRKLAYKTVKLYLCGVLSHARASVRPPPPTVSMFRLSQALTGYKRQLGTASSRRRLPVTIKILRLLKQRIALAKNLNNFNKLMIWAASSLAFFALLRVSELVAPTANSPMCGLLKGHVQVHSSKLIINIPASKTDPFRQGQSVLVGAISSSLCPVTALTNYLKVNTAPSSAPLFVFSDGKLAF